MGREEEVASPRHGRRGGGPRRQLQGARAELAASYRAPLLFEPAAARLLRSLPASAGVGHAAIASARASPPRPPHTPAAGSPPRSLARTSRRVPAVACARGKGEGGARLAGSRAWLLGPATGRGRRGRGREEGGGGGRPHWRGKEAEEEQIRPLPPSSRRPARGHRCEKSSARHEPEWSDTWGVRFNDSISSRGCLASIQTEYC